MVCLTASASRGRRSAGRRRIAVFFPALGPYDFLHLSPADHPHIDLITSAKMTDPILWLRAAIFTDPAPPFTVGLISFPSFHSSVAAIYAWAAWRTPVVRWFALGLNAMILIATPVHGSYHLVDVFAGIAVAPPRSRWPRGYWVASRGPSSQPGRPPDRPPNRKRPGRRCVVDEH
jgi:PAP2 superfamily